MVAEADLLCPIIRQSFPELKELTHDLVALTLRDSAMGADYYLEAFIRDQLGSDYAFLNLFFKAQSARWYGEVVRTAAQLTAAFDEFYIEDIVQLSPTKLLVKVWVEYQYEGESITSENY